MLLASGISGHLSLRVCKAVSVFNSRLGCIHAKSGTTVKTNRVMQRLSGGCTAVGSHVINIIGLSVGLQIGLVVCCVHFGSDD